MIQSEIKWLYGNKISKNDTKEIQTRLDKYFPNDYIRCVLNNDGGYPVPGAFNVEGKMEVINNIFSLDLNKPCNLLSIYEKFKDKLPNDIVPFARDPFGNMLCFDYRLSKIPNICFWRMDRGNGIASLEFVCNTFTELLENLYRVEEEF